MQSNFVFYNGPFLCYYSSIILCGGLPMTSRELYQQKLSTADAAMSLIHSGDTSVSGIYACEPLTLLHTLHTIAPRVRDVKVWCAITKI